MLSECFGVLHYVCLMLPYLTSIISQFPSPRHSLHWTTAKNLIFVPLYLTRTTALPYQRIMKSTSPIRWVLLLSLGTSSVFNLLNYLIRVPCSMLHTCYTTLSLSLSSPVGFYTSSYADVLIPWPGKVQPSPHRLPRLTTPNRQQFRRYVGWYRRCRSRHAARCYQRKCAPALNQEARLRGWDHGVFPHRSR